MSTCRTVQPVSSGGSARVAGRERRTGGGSSAAPVDGVTSRRSRRSVAAREDVQGMPSGAEELAVRWLGTSRSLELEQGGAVGLGVDEGRGHEVAEDAHAVDSARR